MPASLLDSLPEQTTVSLLGGILSDLQQLVAQQLRLTRREIEDEVRLRATAATVFALGLTSLFLAAIVLSLSLVHLMHWAASPPGADPAWLPLWACHATWGAVLTAAGAALVWAGQIRFRSPVVGQNPTL
jgi:hypothetical protein